MFIGKKILEFFAYSCFGFQRDEELLGDLITMHRCLSEVSYALAIAIDNPPEDIPLDIYRSRVVNNAREFCRLLGEFVQQKITQIQNFVAGAISLLESEANTLRSATLNEEDIAERMLKSMAVSYLTYNAYVLAWESRVPNVVNELLDSSQKRELEWFYEHLLNMILAIDNGLQKFWLGWESVLRYYFQDVQV